jgi:hypothetical protein
VLKTKIVKRNVETIKDIKCNSCGKSCKASSGLGYSCATLNAHWGYSSNKDGEKYLAHLCEVCFDNLVKNFKISSLVATEQF